MNLTEQEIQRLLEDGLKKPDNEDMDFNTYSSLFDELHKEPSAGLPYNFPARVTALIQVKHDLKISLKFYVFALLAGVIISAGIYAFLSLVPQQNAVNVLVVLMKYKWILLFGLVCFLVIQYFDQRLKSNRAA